MLKTRDSRLEIRVLRVETGDWRFEIVENGWGNVQMCGDLMGRLSFVLFVCGCSLNFPWNGRNYPKLCGKRERERGVAVHCTNGLDSRV